MKYDDPPSDPIARNDLSAAKVAIDEHLIVANDALEKVYNIATQMGVNVDLELLQSCIKSNWYRLNCKALAGDYYG